METSKKRHNPPIFDEDHSVQAFDRNNDAVPADSLDNLVKNADVSKVQVVKNDSVLSKELCKLLNKIIGIKETEIEDNNAEEAALSDCMTLENEQPRKWYQKRKIEPYLTIEVDLSPPRSSFEDAYTIRQFIHQGKYSPIKITAHTPDAVQKAKVFAAAYQELTKQNAIVVQNCEDVQEEDLERKTKEPSELSKTLRAVGREFEKDFSKVKEKLKDRKTLEGDAFNAVSTISIMPFCTYTGIKRLHKVWTATGNERGGPLEPVFGLVLGMISTTVVSIYAGVQAYKGNYIPLAIVGTTQSLDTVGRYALNLWKRAKNG